MDSIYPRLLIASILCMFLSATAGPSGSTLLAISIAAAMYAGVSILWYLWNHK